MALLTMVSFLVGAFCSAVAGYVGVWISVRANLRVSAAAARMSFADALEHSLRGGAFSAIISAALCILGLCVMYTFLYFVLSIFGTAVHLHQIPMLMVGYGFGASFVALFMQLGGGIYTKAADVGADMVGKIESNIPEDDPRNPAVIADLVGDNVGDCAGSMADVFESIAGEILGTMILGAALAKEAELHGASSFVFFPLMVHSIDLVASAIGILVVKCPDNNPNQDPMKVMKHGYLVTSGVASVGFVIICRMMLHVESAPDAWWHFALCGLVGIAVSYAFIETTGYYTDYQYGPVKSIASASTTGHGTNIISGLAVGLESTAIPTVLIAIGLMSSYMLGKSSGLPPQTAGLFGTAVATMGMLCTAVYILSMNNFGPIADNAGGIVEMSGQPEEVRAITDRLDAVGNVTKATTKGYAVGGSALACFLLFRAFLDEVSSYSGLAFKVVDIAKTEVLVGGLIGIMMIFLFSGWAMQAVGTSAQEVVQEVRRQFQERPGIMNGTERPDYDKCVAIVTASALHEMIKPALLALGTPVFIGLLFKYIGQHQGEPLLAVEVLASFLMFGSLTGLMMAMFMDNAGGAWDNAKKYVEAGAYGGKGSDAHHAAVTGDTVGDPFKDTAGPALHVIITTMSTTILVLGPMFLA
eukprot:TRINITY_DN19076_c0_g1_i1.p1 TRINITY_DN19076_c0_g1~~TRINITY_DN19076_c0_g1_i1.p1  ORF type:complete len:642 (+),score=199.28 TRINITY_DN19076_c0_g1_i1:2-1927(+)